MAHGEFDVTKGEELSRVGQREIAVGKQVERSVARHWHVGADMPRGLRSRRPPD